MAKTNHKPNPATLAFDAGMAMVGVAPEVTFGAYRVFGCDGSTNDDIMLAAMERALALVDGTRSRFRSEEFKIGLFSDLQSVFERAIGLHLAAGDVRRAFEVPLPGGIHYPLAMVKGSRNADEARRFIAFVRSPAGQAILRRHGFGSP